MEKDKQLSLIVYDNAKLPRYYEIRKSFLKFLIYGLPTLALICLFGLLSVLIYFDHLHFLAEKKEPAIIQELREEKAELNKDLLQVKGLNKELQEKLLSGEIPELGALSLFREVPGAEDKTSTQIFRIEEVEVFTSKNKVHFRFNIVNNSKNNRRLSGYFFVLMQEGPGLYVYPRDAFEKKALRIKFNRGESFATYRFRPVDATFPLTDLQEGETLFKIIIFSRTGDLIHKQTISKKVRF